jgi:uncharacterized membrane protein YobD (UPF0266 family)
MHGKLGYGEGGTTRRYYFFLFIFFLWMISADCGFLFHPNDSFCFLLWSVAFDLLCLYDSFFRIPLLLLCPKSKGFFLVSLCQRCDKLKSVCLSV